jgi:CBS-domain-containing membrane protein
MAESLRGALTAGLVMLVAMALLASAEEATGLDVFALPFVASAGVVAMAPRAPLARPAAILLAYATASAVGTAVSVLTGPSVPAATAAAVPSLVAMILLKAPHAPAAVAAAFIGLEDPGPEYAAATVLPATALVLGTALLAGRLLPGYRYPVTWR